MAEERHFDLDVDEPTQRLQEVDVREFLVARVARIDEERPPEGKRTTRGYSRIRVVAQQALC